MSPVSGSEALMTPLCHTTRDLAHKLTWQSQHFVGQESIHCEHSQRKQRHKICNSKAIHTAFRWLSGPVHIG